MTQPNEKVRLDRGGLVSVILATLVMFYLSYLVYEHYGLTWPNLGWTFVFALLVLGISCLKGDSSHEARSMDRPGLLTLRTLFSTLIVIFLLLIPDARTFMDSVASETWPIFVGAGLGWLMNSILALVRAPRG